MNLKVSIYLPFEGEEEDLNNLLQNFADLVVESNYGNKKSNDDDELRSLLTASILDYNDPEEFLLSEIEDASVIVIPMEGEVDRGI